MLRHVLRNELDGRGVIVSAPMPGATESDFFEWADMLDTEVGTAKKMIPPMSRREGSRR